jgi:hypothetical protein
MLSFTNCTDWVRHFKSPKKFDKNLHENFYRSRLQPVAFILTSEEIIYTRKSQTSNTGYRIPAYACRRRYNILSRSVCYLYRLLHQSINENNPRYFFSFPLPSLHNYLIHFSLLHSSSMLFNHLVLACHWRLIFRCEFRIHSRVDVLYIHYYFPNIWKLNSSKLTKNF